MGNNDYYGGGYGSKRERKSILRIIMRIVFGIISICAAVVLALTLVASVMRPEVWWLFPTLAIVAPAVYLINFVIAMVWLVRWRWIAASPIIVLLLLGSGKITRFAKMDMNNHYGEASYKGMTKIMSYNLRGLIDDKGEWSTIDMSQYIDSISPDILCLQELRHQRLFEKLPSKFQNYNIALSKNLGIYSKYPIVAQSENEKMGSSSESKSMWADVKIANDTIRVFNNHLTSTKIKQEDDQYITSREFIVDSLREYKFTDMIVRYKDSSINRSFHADTLAEVIARSPHRVLVCGDFNDTPMSYTYHRVAKGLSDSFVECGVGYPYTYRGFLNTMRIDYIFGGKGIEFKSYMIDTDSELSDHLPVIAHFILTKNK